MELRLELEPSRMPMAVAFAETAAREAGLGELETGELTMSAEELFLALCSSMPGADIRLLFRNRRYAVDLLFQAPQPLSDLRIFNITSRPDLETEQGLAAIGLFLASRMCDQFDLRQLPGGRWEIMLRKDRSYPTASPLQSRFSGESCDWKVISDPPADAVAMFSALISEQYPAAQFPENFSPAGRLLDKLASGEYGVILALDQQGVQAGGLIWHCSEGHIVECYGPYLNCLEGPETLLTALCEKAAELFGRSDHHGMVLYAPQAPPAAAGFDPAGNLETVNGRVWAGYRMMGEDFGAAALVPESLMPFYTAACADLALPRDISICHYNSGQGDGLTLFSTRLDRATGMARLTPLLIGRDAGPVLDEHLHLLDSERFCTTCCVLDTGRPFDTLLVPRLLHHGFVPRLLIPWGGAGDQIHLYRVLKSR